MTVNLIEFGLLLGIVFAKFILPPVALYWLYRLGRWLWHRWLWMRWFGWN